MVEIGNKVIITITLITGLFSLSECLRCYRCTSIELPEECGKVFKLNSTDTKYIEGDCEICQKTILKNSKTIVRDCEKKQSHKVSYRSGCETQRNHGIETKTCSCTSDLCNTAGTTFYPGTIFYNIYLVVIGLCINACLILH